MNMHLSESDRLKNIHAPLTNILIQWFKANKRSLPWRSSYEPYPVWISEVMLQQTQMDRGVTYFLRWMERFPTLKSVAEASLDDILKAWEGLGYYSRARNLHAAAQIIMQQHSGSFPENIEDIRKLPGVGEYTAGAVASIAFNQPVVAVDANVERVFSRLFDVALPCKTRIAAGFIREMAQLIMPKGKARVFNQAIMEFGALVCKKRPNCTECPLRAYCHAFRLEIVDQRPVLGKKTEYDSLQVVSGVLVHKGKVFLQKRLETGMWAGLWEFPGGRLEFEETPSQGIIREFFEETGFSIKVHLNLGTIQHAYTRYRVTLHCFLCCFSEAPQQVEPVPILEAATEYKWVLPEDLHQYALPAGHRKLVERDLNLIASHGNTL